jgi:hypothetical protein
MRSPDRHTRPPSPGVAAEITEAVADPLHRETALVSPRIIADPPTPEIGVCERTSIGAYITRGRHVSKSL